MIRAASLGIDTDLLQYSQFLRSQGIKHRIIEESGQQVIWVGSELEKQFVSTSLPQFIEAIDTGRLPATAPVNRSSFSGKPLLNAILRAFIASPITLTLITLSLLVAAVSVLGSQAARVSFLFYPLIAPDGVFALLGDITSLSVLLKTLTPMFLHFGELHLVFNMLWLWYFGKQLERIQSPWIFLSLVLATSFISNTTQYLYIDYNNFGGMSGVVYGLVGYTWVVHTFMPRSSLLLNNNMFVFFVLALVIMEIIASSWIATAAHVGGLVSGLVLGVMAVLYYRVVRRQQSISRR
ncbi:MAG: rhomboid family intramembrane serine protease [Proteobacteria bacterium]|nr:rhomboid family intramembrane serine protease [Pseudomonadota bacterium]